MGSGVSGRRLAGPFRGILLFLLDLLALGPVARTGLPAVADALGVEGAADDLVADARQVLHPAAADEHDRVLLEVVADTRDVGGDLDAAGQPDPADLAQGRVGLLGRGRVDARADTPPLGRTLQRRRLGLLDLALAALADQLGDRWQSPLLADCSCCSFNSTVSGVYSVLGPPGSQCSIGRGQGLQSGPRVPAGEASHGGPVGGARPDARHRGLRRSAIADGSGGPLTSSNRLPVMVP